MIKRLFTSWLVLLLFAGPTLTVTGQAQSTPNPLLGAWSGQLHYGDESKMVGLRFALDEKHSIVALVDVPDLKFRNLGPLPVELQGTEYHAHQFTFRLSLDNKKLSGVWSFDDHEVPFELAAGELRVPSPTTELVGRVAKPVWIFKTGGPIWSSPVADGRAVYFGSNDGSIYAVTAVSGKAVWRFETGGCVMGKPTVDGTHVYALSDDGFLYKLQKTTGKLIWKFDTNGGSVRRDMVGSQTGGYDTMTSAAVIAGGIVYIGSADKRLYAIDAESGREKWHFDTEGIVRSTPAVSNGVVFFGSRDHRVYAVDAKSGSVKWKYDTLREVVSSPLVVNGTVYIGSRCSDLFAFDAGSGRVKWKYFYWSSWVESSARMMDGILYVGSSDAQKVSAIDSRTGRGMWSFDTNGSNWSTPAVTKKRVYEGAAGVMNYFIDHHGGFFAIDRITGNEVWHYPMVPIPGSSTYGVASSPAVHDGLVFFGGLDGQFYAFAENG